MKTPIKYHGGKSGLAKRIVSMMPPHRNYVEPFFGGGSVFFEHDSKDCCEVINDRAGMVANFWRTLRDPSKFAEFLRMVQAAPVSEPDFHRAMGLILRSGYIEFSVKEAVDFFILARQSLGGRLDSFAPISRERLRRGMCEQVSSWMSAIAGLPAVHARLARVAILCRPAIAVVNAMDSEDTLFYLDPPYLQSTRMSREVYQFEMSEGEHSALLVRLGTIKGKLILSGYRSDLYDGMAEAYGWGRIDIDVPNNAASGKSKRRMTECLWMNFNPSVESV